MNFLFTLLLVFLFSNNFVWPSLADELEKSSSEEVPVMVGNKKVIYVYKKYEKIDFNDLDIQGDTGYSGDLSIDPIHEKRFANRLPYRKSFNVEIKKGIERVR
jgi:hypothetical protein